MEPSQTCIDLIKSFESCRLTAYQDTGGLWTIGWGHKSQTIHAGDTITQAQADAYMLSDVRECALTVSRLISGSIVLTQGQFDACVSFAYNVGTGRFQNSTLLKKIKSGDMAGAADEFLKWNEVAKKVVAGLTRRRKAERELFLGGPNAA